MSRENILNRAAWHFAEYGFRGSSAAAIAHEADMSEPGLLHHFGSKVGLLMALLEMRYSLDESKLEAEKDLDGLQLLPLLVHLVRENVTKKDSVRLSMVMLAESLSTSHPSHKFYKRRYTRAREIVTKHLARAQQLGFIRKEIDCPALATTMLAVMDGLQLQWLLDPKIDMAECFERFVVVLEPALAKPR
ncbi:MAG TPA: TetR/AcrR family transcriptional regulator [Steroidobacteraceae bacterium]|nr:TetR/AcrR family transcriptional regulator [Steroidobacteraceae bacterium]